MYFDLSGRMPTPSFAEKEYIGVAIDEASRYVAIQCITTKAEASAAIQKTSSRIANQGSLPAIKALRMDNGGENIPKEIQMFIDTKGIPLELTSRYTPQQNGMVERVMRTLTEGIRALLVHCEGPIQLWEWAAHIASSTPRTAHHTQR
jgi:transposase InsO family protein